MKVVLSVAQPLGGSGPSKPLTALHHGLQRARSVEATTIHAGVFNGMLDDVSGFGHGLGPVYDDLAASHLGNFVPPDVFLGGGGASKQQIRLMCANNVPVGTMWFSTHWRNAMDVLGPEYARFGANPNVVHPYLCWRAECEQDASQFLIVPSEQAKQTYPENLRHKVHVAEFGVDLDRYQPTQKRTGQRLKVLFPATNPIRKGLHYAIQGWKDLPTSTYQMTVTGAQLGQLPTNLAPIVSTGFVPEAAMDKLYRDHDVLLLPSLEEGQALAGLEALASGIPIIVTKETGIPITDGVEGFVVPARDPEAIRKALIALAHRDTYAKMSVAARKWAEKRPWQFFVDQVVKVLEKQVKPLELGAYVD